MLGILHDPTAKPIGLEGLKAMQDLIGYVLYHLP